MACGTRPRHLWLTFAVLTSGVGGYATLQSLVVPVLPTIQRLLGTSQSAVTWVLTAYLVSASIFTPVLGRIGDIVGKKQTFIAALVALCIGSIMGALAESLPLMIVARVIQGVGGGALPLAFSIIRDVFPADRVAGAVGSLASIVAVGAGLGIVLAGPIDKALGIHWLFWMPAILIALSAAAAWVVVPASPVRAARRFNLLPAVLLSAWLVCGLLALSEAPNWGWGSGRVLGLLAAAAVFAAFWATSERRAASPLIDLRMMALPAVWTTNCVALLSGVGMYASFAFLPQFLQTPRSTGYGFGASITQSGLMIVPSSAAMFLVGLTAGRLVRAFGAKRLIFAGSAIAAISFVLLAAEHDHRWQLYLVNAVMGAGFGLTFSSMASLIVNAVPHSQTGVASGMNANIRTIGGSIGAAAMASIVTAGTRPGQLPHESAYTAGFVMLAATSALGALAALLIPAVPGHVATDVTHQHPEIPILAGGAAAFTAPVTPET